jgi:hypothetical protein
MEHPIRVVVQDLLAPWIIVSIDGKPEKMVIEADEESGTVWRYATTFTGELIVEGEEIKKELLTGQVKLSLAEGAPEPAVFEYQRLRRKVIGSPPHLQPSPDSTPPAVDSDPGAR